MSTPILTAAAMRAAEDAVIEAGTTATVLMERAGAAVAHAARAYSGATDALVLCGPGNKGGDGYVIARTLRAGGMAVRVAASAAPAGEVALRARDRWNGAVEPIDDVRPATLLIDALFGTGLKRGLQPALNASLLQLATRAAFTVAVDLPSGIHADDGALLSPVPAFGLTVALGALKPAHMLQPAASRMGRLAIADIGVPVASDLTRIDRPHLPAPGAQDHKYTRGFVTVVAGTMPGAANLAALGAARSGAGYVQLFGNAPDPVRPAAIVQRAISASALASALADIRIGALVVGPGLGRHEHAQAVLNIALASGRPLVLDADALWHLGSVRPGAPAILTPHEGEFVRMFGDLPDNKVDRVRRAAEACGAVVLLKGADTVIAHPDGRAAIAAAGASELATAGTGDVLAGICGTLLAQLGDPFTAACGAAWLHAAASHALAGPFVADDLAAALPALVAACR